MQSLVTSVFFMVNGIGAFLGSLMIAIGNACGMYIIGKHKEKRLFIPALKGYLHYFYYFLAGLNFLNWIAFVIYGIRRRKRKQKRQLEHTVAAYIQGSLEASLRKT